MMCAWDKLLQILPKWIADETDGLDTREIQEIRLRIGAVPELNMGGRSCWLRRTVTQTDLTFVINTVSQYSPWSAVTASQGYLTAQGGHRIGICGDVIMKSGYPEGIRNVQSLCIRVARDYQGIGHPIAACSGSVLILGPPGSGKTTLLRDVLRSVASRETVGVVDERGELFPVSFTRGRRMDVLTGCPKAEGIDMLLRTMGPACIGVDEITSERDCEALIRAGWCGVRLIATAHALSVDDLRQRPIYSRLYGSRLFEHIFVLRRDKTWQEERMAG